MRSYIHFLCCVYSILLLCSFFKILFEPYMCVVLHPPLSLYFSFQRWCSTFFPGLAFCCISAIVFYGLLCYFVVFNILMEINELNDLLCYFVVFKTTVSFRNDWLGLPCLMQLLTRLHVSDYYNFWNNER